MFFSERGTIVSVRRLRGFVLPVIGAVLAALTLSACGSESSTTKKTASATQGSTDATANGPAVVRAREREIRRQKKAAARAFRKAKEPVKNGQGGGAESPAKRAPSQKGQELSPANTRAVKAAFNKYMTSLNERNVSYVCDHLYSAEYLRIFNKGPGCESAVNKIISGVRSYKWKISDAGPVAGTDLAQVYTLLTIKRQVGEQVMNTVVYFAKEGGEWKRTVEPPEAQAH